MLIRGVVVLIIYSCTLVYHIPKFTNYEPGEKLIYWVLMLISLYLALIFVLQVKWPNLNHLIDFFFSGLGHQVADYFKKS